MSTVGQAAAALASPQTYTAARGVRTVVCPASTTKSVQKVPGRLCRVLVTTTLGAAATFYDNNVGDNSGTIIGVIASGAVAGTVVDFGMPAANGITAILAGTGQVTASVE